MRVLPSLAILCLLLAGCASTPDDGVPAPAPVAELPAPIGFSLLCPPGGTDVDGVCAYRITSLTETNQEPFVAVHPTDPNITAIGVNAGHTTNGLSAHGETSGFDMVRLDIFITTDGGATWTTSTLPYVRDPDVTLEPVETSVIGDPALQFGTDGRLHVSGIASHSQARGYNVFYTHSDDLGDTWQTPTVLSSGDDNDRNWLNIGPDGTIYVPWQRVGSLSEIAWSTDNGDSWNTQSRSTVASDCITVSEMAFMGDKAYVACSQRISSGYQVVVYTFANGHLKEVAKPEGMSCVWPKLATTTTGLFLTGEGCPSDLFTTSTDGIAWDPIEQLDALTGGSNVMWLTDDPWGNLHFLLASPRQYVAVDVATGEILARQSLPGEASGPAAPETLAPSYGDHYWGIDVSRAGGALVWTRGDNLDVSFLAPVFPAAA